MVSDLEKWAKDKGVKYFMPSSNKQLLLRITLVCRQSVPFHCFGIILHHAVAKLVFDAEDNLRFHIALISRHPVPFQ